MRTTQWQIEWVEDMPERMEAATLYISVKHRLTEHLCACGCGTEVSLHLGRSEWRLIYDGDSISVWPSVGNWRLLCNRHYVIQESEHYGVISGLMSALWQDEKRIGSRNYLTYEERTQAIRCLGVFSHRLDSRSDRIMSQAPQEEERPELPAGTMIFQVSTRTP